MGIALNLLRLSRSVNRLALFREAEAWMRSQPQYNIGLAISYPGTSSMRARPEAYPALADLEDLPKMILCPRIGPADEGAFGGEVDVSEVDCDTSSITCGQSRSCNLESVACSRRAVLTSTATLLGLTCLPPILNAEDFDDPDAFPELPMDAKFLAKWHRADLRDSVRNGDSRSFYFLWYRLERKREVYVVVGRPDDVDYFGTWGFCSIAVLFDDQAVPYSELEQYPCYQDSAVPILDYYGTADGTALAFISDESVWGWPLAQD